MPSPDRIETISVHIDPDSVPDTTDCLNCGPNAPIRKVPGEYCFDTDGVRIVNTEPIIDYSCDRCGMGGICDAMAVGLPLDKATLAKLEELGIDRPLQNALRNSITTLERFLAARVRP